MDLTAAQRALDKEDVSIRSTSSSLPSTTSGASTAGAANGRRQFANRPKTRATRGRIRTRARSFQAMLAGLSALCIVAGIYIVYNTTATGAVHRAYAIALLRVLGGPSAGLFTLHDGGGSGSWHHRNCAWHHAGNRPRATLERHRLESMGVIFQLRFPVSAFAIRANDLVVIERSASARRCSLRTSPPVGSAGWILRGTTTGLRRSRQAVAQGH